MSDMFVVIGILIFLVLITMLLSNSHTLQRFALLEMLLIAAVGLSTFFSLSRAQEFMKEQYVSMFCLYIDDARMFAGQMENEKVEDSDAIWQKRGDDLQRILDYSLPVSEIEGERLCYLTAAIYERTPGGGYLEKTFRQTKSRMTNTDILNCVTETGEKAVRLGSVMCEETTGNSAVLVYAAEGVLAPAYLFVTEIPLEPLLVKFNGMLEEYVRYAIVFLAAATLLLVIVVGLQGRQLRRLAKRVVRAAEGKEDWESLKDNHDSFWIESNEMRKLKNGLSQIAADVARLNYKNYRVLQSYYRFAPKQIENIFGKQSIFEVETNDRIDLEGTLAFVTYTLNKAVGEQEYIRRMSRECAILSEKQKEYGGFMLSDSSDLTTMQLLFRENPRKALLFGIDVAMRQQMGEQGGHGFILLHHTDFLYGIAGNEEQAFTYVLSKEMKILERYVERFQSIGIRMAVTDSVYEIVGKETTGRYIGYLEGEGCTFKLYEILDAYPAKERQKRINTMERFEKALNLFYQEDYYLGRSLFTEVLKECPDDEVAKWYLFLCEKCLDTERKEDISCALFSD